jgi:Arc/MetJ-type ribon-helix-helix transcriptional regulator
MSATFTISLPEALRAALDDQAAKGGYSSRDEYVLNLVRRDQARAERGQLAAELSPRSDETDSVVMDADDFRQIRAEVRRRLGQPEAS